MSAAQQYDQQSFNTPTKNPKRHIYSHEFDGDDDMYREDYDVDISYDIDTSI